jgi:hypothetical protein
MQFKDSQIERAYAKEFVKRYSPHDLKPQVGRTMCILYLLPPLKNVGLLSVAEHLLQVIFLVVICVQLWRCMDSPTGFCVSGSKKWLLLLNVPAEVTILLNVFYSRRLLALVGFR